jgi:hypothetical protein
VVGVGGSSVVEGRTSSDGTPVCSSMVVLGADGATKSGVADEIDCLRTLELEDFVPGDTDGTIPPENPTEFLRSGVTEECVLALASD